MREQVGRDVVGCGALLGQDALEEARDGGWRIAGAGHEDGAQLVRFRLVLAAEFELHRDVRGLGRDQDARLLGRHRGRHPRDPDQQVRKLRRLLHARVVAGFHVRDLVPHHTRQLGLAARRQQGSAVEVDVAARHREGVQAGIVDHPEAVDERLWLDLAHDLLAQVVEVARHQRVLDHAHVLRELAVEVHPELALVVVAHLTGELADRIEARAVVLHAAREGDQAEQQTP
jgi:hypothetical protein